MKIKTKALLFVMMLCLVLYPSGSSLSQSIEIQAAGSVTPLLQYQGRLTNPTTGSVVADGSYPMLFELFNVSTVGTALWSESKTVVVSKGLFSTVLGDTTPLDPHLFNGQALWLQITVDGEKLEPRQSVLPVAYALSLVPGAVVESSSGPVLRLTNLSGGEALRVGGNLNVSGSLIGGSHTHSGENITSGTVADARIASTIARDNEVMAIVLASDGPGTTLNADLLDGLHSSSFANATHYHDDRYYTEAEANSLYVNATGDTMSGTLTVPKITYSPARTRYFSVGGEAFNPGSNVAYTNTYGMGGAYISSGSGALVAPVHLPQGAVVTSFKVFFNDTSTSNMDVYLDCLSLTSGGYSSLANVSSTGISGYGNISDTTITNGTINNTTCGYTVYAYSTSWNSSLKIMGALITYTVSEAQ
jgi:hypothetical protein